MVDHVVLKPLANNGRECAGAKERERIMRNLSALGLL